MSRRKYKVSLTSMNSGQSYDNEIGIGGMIGSSSKEQDARESALLKLISQLNAMPNSTLTPQQAGQMLVDAEKRYQLSKNK